ncbi:hypothetical protein [Burkholderia sp. SIMBA_062]
MSYPHWENLKEQLRQKGFREQPDDEAPICAMFLAGMRVDFMPDDEAILNFGNAWYRDALASAEHHDVGEGVTVRIVRPAHFVATKLVAYLSRGNGDPLESHDVEDILTLLDGRPEIAEEILAADADMRTYISTQLAALLEHRDFEYAIEAASNGDAAREEVIRQRVEVIVSYAKLT